MSGVRIPKTIASGTRRRLQPYIESMGYETIEEALFDLYNSNHNKSCEEIADLFVNERGVREVSPRWVNLHLIRIGVQMRPLGGPRNIQHIVIFHGKEMSLGELAKIYNVTYHVMYHWVIVRKNQVDMLDEKARQYHYFKNIRLKRKQSQ